MLQHQRSSVRAGGAMQTGRRCAMAPPLSRTAVFGAAARRHGARAAAAAAAGAVLTAPPPSTAAADAPTTKDPVPAPAAAPAPTAKFDWAKAWYPAAAEEHLDPSQPHRVSIAGRNIVLWRGANDEWRAQQDECPHRLASLTDGFIDAANDQIVCSYHGWRFGKCGGCADIPQLNGEPTALATACASARTRLATFPVQVRGGLIWVWPDASPSAAAESAAAPVPLPTALEDEALSPLKGRWFVREQPISFDMFLENLLDPAHVDFAHDGVAGFAAEAHRPLRLELVEDSGPAGFQYRVIPSKPGARPSRLTFVAPGHVSIIEEDAPAAPAASAAAGGAAGVEGQEAPRPQDVKAVRPGSSNPDIRSALVFYVFPSTKPGWSRFHGTSFIAGKDGKPVRSASIFSRALPPWLTHTLGHTFLAGDDVHLHYGGKALALAGFDHAKAYYPVSQDAAVLHMRRWLDGFAGGSPPWPAPLQGAAALLANLDLEREQVLDRYTAHVKHCKHCREALATTEKTASVAGAVAAVAAVAAGFALLAAQLLPTAAAAASSTTAGATGTAAAAAAAAAAAVAALNAVGAGPLCAVAAAAWLVRGAAAALVRQFRFVDFVRKPFAPSKGAAVKAAVAAAAPAAAPAPVA